MIEGDFVTVFNHTTQSEIAKLITREQGKTIPDAEGDVLRGLRMLFTHGDAARP